MQRRIVTVILCLAVLTVLVVAAEDKYALKVPGGLAFSEFRGYERWQTIAVSRNDKAILRRCPTDSRTWTS